MKPKQVGSGCLVARQRVSHRASAVAAPHASRLGSGFRCLGALLVAPKHWQPRPNGAIEWGKKPCSQAFRQQGHMVCWYHARLACGGGRAQPPVCSCLLLLARAHAAQDLRGRVVVRLLALVACGLLFAFACLRARTSSKCFYIVYI
jgi:hypothetical protein